MRIELGGQTVLLDSSGCAILPAHGIVCINQPAWATAQRPLFPEASLENRFRDELTRIAGSYTVATAAITFTSHLNRQGELNDLLQSVGLDTVWVGGANAPSEDVHAPIERLQIGGLAIALDPSESPALVGGFAPGDTGGSCYLLAGERLLLPCPGSYSPRLPDRWPRASRAFWIGPRGIEEAVFEAPEVSLR